MNDIFFFGENKPLFYPNQPLKIIKPIQFKFENETQIKQISTGQFATIFLFKDGKAIQYLKEEKDLKQNIEKIQIEENIQKVTVGWRNEAILTIEGNVFAKGKDINSENPNEFINISSLIEDKNDRIIEDIVCGSSSIYLLTSNQNAYGIGSNYYGQLGFQIAKKEEKPILMMKNVSKIFSGNYSTSVFLLNSNQELFGCGYNFFGRLGIKTLEGQFIAWFHSIMLIEDENENENPKRKLYSCGCYHYNGLGQNEDVNEFTEIKSSLFENDNILDFSARGNHTLILTSKGKLIGFGSNFSGQLGIEKIEKQNFPIQIELPKLRFNEDISNYHVHCGLERSFLYYSPSFSNLEEDLIKLYQRKEFCNISFKTENGEIIEAHKLILKYRLNQNQNEIEKLQEIISKINQFKNQIKYLK
ncbi:regulator of chromosome condensation [Anaeramoeba ignava]|uniref:Regulator of chromosome condensation n=1 Tax=Anaeramoeba ignava TaxID=1746090 RepID=A0A9Q0LKU5_ANAIG|nr:regulator of chromosome condensation [Anaeramoeba ignava]